MKEKIAVSRLGRCLDTIDDSSFDIEGKELESLCSITDPNSLVDDSPKPFAAFGSFRQRNGDALAGSDERDGSTRRRLTSREAPAKLGSGSYKKSLGSAAEPVKTESPSTSAASEPIEIKILKEMRVAKRLQKKSISTDIDRDEAWERKRDLFLVDGLDSLDDDEMPRNVGRSASDYGGKTSLAPPLKDKSKSRTRSLTDEDLEELRGCIDLGFTFDYDESCNLRNTLPALDLYCAINRQYNDMKIRSSPVSPLEGTPLERSSSVDSAASSVADTWRISSPGDHPSQVKARLRHWAQAVACSIRQGTL